jgi:hypothetical protein
MNKDPINVSKFYAKFLLNQMIRLLLVLIMVILLYMQKKDLNVGKIILNCQLILVFLMIVTNIEHFYFYSFLEIKI